MGGWVALFGDISNFEGRLRNFKKVFNIENFEKLNFEVKKYSNDFISISWSWRKIGMPDISISSINNNTLILCGAVTDLGRFNLNNSNITADKIINLWNEHGENLMNEINGSWSLVFFNSREKSVTTFVDRFASRSIWISKDDKVWIIGNFPSAVVSMRKNSTHFDPAGLFSLFYASRHLPGQSLYKEVFTISAGVKARLDYNGHCSLGKWWVRKYHPDYRIKPKLWGEYLAHALKQSAERIKRISPNPFLFLSGGLDSRIVAASMGRPLTSYTLCNLPNMESRCARLVAKTIGIKHNLMIRSPYWNLDALKAASLISSGNNLTMHTHFIKPVIEINKLFQNASFLLGDLLENLNKHYFNIPKGIPFSFNVKDLPSFLNKFVPGVTKNPTRLLNMFNKDIRERLKNRWIDALHESSKLVLDVSEDVRDKVDTYLRWIDVSVTYTYNMFTCIWPFASERNIFFDNEINNLSLKIPSHIRSKGIIHPWILWHLNKSLLIIPNANNFLPPFVPKSLQNFTKTLRPKIGALRRRVLSKTTSGPLKATSGSWALNYELYRKDKRYKDAIKTLLNDDIALPQEIFEHGEIQNVWKEFLDGSSNLLFEIDALISFSSLHNLIRCNGIGW